MIVILSRSRPFIAMDKGNIRDRRLREKRSNLELKKLRKSARAMKPSRMAYALYHERFKRKLAREPEKKDAALPPFPIIRGTFGGLDLIIPDSGDRVASLERRMQTGRAISIREAFLRRQIAGCGAFIDIGANIGMTTIPHVLMNDFSAYIAFEPEQRNLACLRYNLERNGLEASVEVRWAAVGERARQLTLAVTDFSGHHFINFDHRRRKSARTYQTVPVVTLDQIVLEQDCPVALVKCDTQGHEGHILRGAQEFLSRRTACWYLEFWPKGLERAGSDVRDVCGLIEANFSSFVDPQHERPCVQPVGKLREAVSYISQKKFTDLLLMP